MLTDDTRAGNLVVARTWLARLAAGDLDGLLELAAPDITFEIPFDIPGMPSRIEGRAALRRFLEMSTAVFELPFEVEVVDAHPIAARAAWILEYESQATVSGTTHRYRNRYIGLFEFVDGTVGRWVEYPNPLPILEVLRASPAGGHQTPR